MPSQAYWSVGASQTWFSCLAWMKFHPKVRARNSVNVNFKNSGGLWKSGCLWESGGGAYWKGTQGNLGKDGLYLNKHSHLSEFDDLPTYGLCILLCFPL